MASLLRSRFLVSSRNALVGRSVAWRQSKPLCSRLRNGLLSQFRFSMASVVIALQRISVQLLTLLMPSENKLKLEIWQAVYYRFVQGFRYYKSRWSPEKTSILWNKRNRTGIVHWLPLVDHRLFSIKVCYQKLNQYLQVCLRGGNTYTDDFVIYTSARRDIDIQKNSVKDNLCHSGLKKVNWSSTSKKGRLRVCFSELKK